MKGCTRVANNRKQNDKRNEMHGRNMNIVQVGTYDRPTVRYR